FGPACRCLVAPVPERYGHWQRAEIWPLIWAKLRAFADTRVDRLEGVGGFHDLPGPTSTLRTLATDTVVRSSRRGQSPADHGLGRSRGTRTTKIHLAWRAAGRC